MKKFILFFFVALALTVNARATDIVISSTVSGQVPFNPSNLGSSRTFTVTATNGSATVTSSAAFPSTIVGKSGFTIMIGTTYYTVAAVASTSSLTLTAAFSGSTGSATLTLFPYTLFRAYPSSAFQTSTATSTSVTVSVTSGSQTVTSSAAFASQYVGVVGGFQVLIGSTPYRVLWVASTSSMTLASPYAGSTGSTTMVFDGVQEDVQASTPGSGNWYKEVAVSLINAGGGNTLYYPSWVLPATTNATINNQARYVLNFYNPAQGNSLLGSYSCGGMTSLAISSLSTPTTLANICTFNVPGGNVPPNTTVYTVPQIDSRFPSCTAGQSYYFNTSGNAVSCLNYGSGLTLTGSTLTASGGGSSITDYRGAINVSKAPYSCAADGVSNDTTCIASALTAAAASTGKIVYLPAGTYLVTGITVPGGVTVVGDGPQKTIIYSTTNGVIVNGVVGTGSYAFIGPTIRDLKIKGSKTAGSSQIALKMDDATYFLQGLVENVQISTAGSYGLYVGNAFSSRFINIYSDDNAGYPFLINSPNMPSNHYESLYAQTVNSGGNAGFRVLAGNFICISCNGINTSAAGSYNAIIGSKIGTDGSVSNIAAFAQWINSNFESAKAGGILHYYNSVSAFSGKNTFAGDAASSGSYKAMVYEVTTALFPPFFSKGVIDDSVIFSSSPAAFYASSSPIWANDLPPLTVNGQGPKIAGGAAQTTYYNSTNSQSETLYRSDGYYPTVAVTTSKSFSNPGNRYYEVTCGSNCTLTLPWPGWYQPAGEPVVIKNLSATGIIVTLAANSGGSVNTPNGYTLTEQYQSVSLMPDSTALDWRVNSKVSVGVATRVPFYSDTANTTTDADLTFDGFNLQSGRFQFTGGTAGAPALASATDTDTGLYSSAANTMAFAANGANVLSMGTGGLTLGAAASVTGNLLLANSSNSNLVTLKAGVTGASQTYTWPIAVGAAGTSLTDVAGNGTLSWVATGACPTCVTSAAALTANQLVIGAGLQASAALGTLGTTTTVLHGNAAGAPTFGAVSLTADVSGILPVANGGTGLASGTSGGILAYTASGTLASSGALTANLPVIGGGAGVAPTVGTRSGNTTAFVTTTGAQTSGDCVKIDASGNHVANGSACGGAGSSALSAITAATGTNTISSGDNGSQIWRWSLTTNSTTAFSFTESAASIATSSYILNVNTLATSTAKPIKITAGGTTAGVEMSTAGVLGAIGAGQIQATPAGASGNIQFNSGGGLMDATTAFSYDLAGTALQIGTASTTSGKIQLRSATSAFDTFIAPGTPAGTATITLPAATSTLATLALTETLSGKTLTAPKIVSGGFIADANGNEQIIFTTTASAVNEFTFANAATGGYPTIAATGGDSNINIVLTPKGTGNLTTGAGFVDMTSSSTASAFRSATGNAAGAAVHPGTGGGFLMPFIGGSQSSGPGIWWTTNAYNATSGIWLNNGFNFQGASSTHSPIKIRKGTGTSSDGTIVFTLSPDAGTLALGPFGTSAGNTSEIDMLELAANGTNVTGFKAPDSLAADLIYTMPSVDGSNTYVLQTNGSKVLSWVPAGGSGANTALSNLASVSINTSLIPQTGVNLGAAATPFKYAFLYGDGTFATTSLKLTGTPTANRTITFPDATDTVVTLAAAQVLTNKDIDSATNNITLPISDLTDSNSNVTFSQSTFNTGFSQTTGLWTFVWTGGTGTNSLFKLSSTSTSATGYILDVVGDAATSTLAPARFQAKQGDALIIDVNKNVILGNGSLSTSATNGWLYLASSAGVPAGTPASLPTGRVPIQVDTTNGRLYGYYSSAWNNLSSSGSGTVTSVSVTTANGVSGSVATATTTPAISLTLGDITPTSVVASTAGVPYTGTNTTNSSSLQTLLLRGARSGVAGNDEAYASLSLANSAAAQKEVARITWAIPTNTAASENGRLDFSVMTAGTLAKELQLAGDDLSPSTSDGLALGTTSLMWSDLFLASGAVINFNNGDVTITHSAGKLTVNNDIIVTSAGTAVGSVLTTDGAQTVTNKTLTSSTNTLGGVTMTLGSDANGDTYYRASGVLTRLAKGTAGQVLAMNGTATAPEWAAATAGGTVTNTGTVTANGFVFGNGGVDIKATAAATNGQLLIGSTSANPVAAAPTGSNGITATLGAGTLDYAFTTNATAGNFVMLPAAWGLSDTAAVLASSTNVVRVLAFYLPYRITIDRVGLNGVTSSAAGKASLGIYSFDGNTLIIAANSIATDGAWSGTQTVTPGTTGSIGPGYYYFAWSCDNTTATMRSGARNANAMDIFNLGGASAYRGIGTAANAMSAGVLPSTLGSITAASNFDVPIVKWYKN